MIRLSLLCLLFAMFTALSCSASADFDPSLLKSGDLIFQRSQSSQAAAIVEATDSPYTHVGIIGIIKGQPYVLEAAATVRITPLKKFIARSKTLKSGAKGFALYRDAELDDSQREQVYEAAKHYLGRSYDLYFSTKNKSIYCSELIWRAYEDKGLSIGKVEKVGDLNLEGRAAKALFVARYKKHPVCKGVSKKSCVEKIRASKIMTPEGLLLGKPLTKLYSAF